MGEENPGAVGHGRIADIEVLRAIAVGMVLAHHACGVLIPWLAAPGRSPYGPFSAIISQSRSRFSTCSGG